MRISRMTIPCGEAGTDATVRVMRSMIEEGKRDQAVRQLAETILISYDVPRYQYVTELAALHDWVRRNVRYTKDPHEVEYIQTPRRLLQSRMGDCDDMAVLLGSLAEVVGHPVGIKVVSRDANRNFHHVYPVAEIDGHEYGLDASVPFPFGYQSPDIKKQRVYPSNGVSGMRDVYYGLGKIPPGGGSDGAAAGDTIPITFGPDPRAKIKVSVLGPGARICGPDVLDRMRKGTIRPNFPTTRLRLLSATESGAGVPCVIAEDVGVYERPIEPPIVGPPGMLDVSAPIALREGQRLCRPDIRTLFERGLIRVEPGTVLRLVTDAATGTPCAAAVRLTDVKIPTKPDIHMPPPIICAQGDVLSPGGVCTPVSEEQDVYIPPPDVRKPAERPDVYMPPPEEAIPAERRAEYEPVPYRPPGITPAAIVEAAQEGGPLGLPWIVWMGAAGLLVTVLMKK
jgi:hypothetical protein